MGTPSPEAERWECRQAQNEQAWGWFSDTRELQKAGEMGREVLVSPGRLEGERSFLRLKYRN